MKENLGEVVSTNELVTSCLNVDGLSYDIFVDVCNFVDQTYPDVVFLWETKRQEEQLGFDIRLTGYDVLEGRTQKVIKEEVELRVTLNVLRALTLSVTDLRFLYNWFMLTTKECGSKCHPLNTKLPFFCLWVLPVS